jgi:hypothetical protein
LEAQKTVNSEGNTEQKRATLNCAGTTIPNFKLYYKVIVEKRMCGTSTQTDTKISGTKKKTQIWIHAAIPNWFFTKTPKTYMKKGQPFQQILFRKLNIYMQKTETRSMSFIQYKYQLKVD